MGLSLNTQSETLFTREEDALPNSTPHLMSAEAMKVCICIVPDMQSLVF